MDIKTETLAYWYFRLNGFLGNQSQIIHKDLDTSDHATDIDYMGIRFSYRKELFVNESNWMKDDENSSLFKYCPNGKNFICFAEIKNSIPRINTSWTDESNNTLKQLLMSLGIINIKHIPKVIRRLQTKGFCNIYKNYITFVAVGESNHSSLIQFDRIPIISWDEILRFIYNRFHDYKLEKSNLGEWSSFAKAKELRDRATKSYDFDTFKKQIRISPHD